MSSDTKSSDQTIVAVLGGGSFGTAIADIAGNNNHHVFMWLRDDHNAQEINKTRENKKYLPGFTLSKNIVVTSDLSEAVGNADIIFVSVPSKVFREVVRQCKPFAHPDACWISTAKGIEKDSFLLMSQVLKEEVPNARVGVLSGPNLAKEIMEKMPTATVIASEDEQLRKWIQDSISCGYLRVYANKDVYGVELGGALKNIYAIVSGIAAALGAGENTKSLLITRSLAEMSRFAHEMGANPMTFIGLAGVGDLIVTCSSPLSRNYQIGYNLGKGLSLEEAVEKTGQTAEGVNTVGQVYQKAKQLDVYMPLVSGLYAMLFEQKPLDEVIMQLMGGQQANDVDFVM